MSRKSIAALGALLLVALVAAGCGSSSSDSTGSESTGTASGGEATALTKAEFIKQGDEICGKGNNGIEAEANEFAEENGIDKSKPTEAQQEEVIGQVVGPAIKQEGEEIGELPAPEGEEEQVEAIVAAIESGAGEVETSPGEILKGKSPLAEATKLAKEYGFKVCGEQ